MNRDKEIDLRELLYYALKRWRTIVIISLIAALAFAVFSFPTGRNSAEDADKQEEREQLVSELNTLKERLDSQIEYNKNSVLMKIDPLCKYRSTFQIYFDTEREDGESGTSYDTNAARRLAAAYSSYLTSKAYYSYVLENTDANKDLKGEDRYLREILWHSVDAASGNIIVNISGDTEERVAETLVAVKKAINEEYPIIKDEVCDHDIFIIMESMHSLVDSSIGDTQETYTNMVDTYKKAIDEKETQLAAFGGQKAESGSFGVRQIAKIIIKAIIVACIVALLAIVCYMALGIFSKKMWNKNSWSGNEIPILGEIYSDKKGKCKKIDRLMAKISGCEMPELSMEDSASLAAASAAAALSQREDSFAAVICTVDKELSDSAFSALYKAGTDVFSFAGNILTQPDAINSLSDKNNIILLADGEKITIDEVNKILELLTAWGKKLLGVILIK